MLLALDQGTTSTRAILFDATLRPQAMAQRSLAQHFPHPGWVEHEPEDLIGDSIAVLREAAAAAPGAIAAIGITNQRETTLLWRRDSGQALHRAIVWQDRRTAEACTALPADLITARTGLLPDPYFSATKLAWLLDTIPGARADAEAGRLCFGTVDSFLLFRLTEGRVHATDATNASRTMLWNIHRGEWDRELLDLFRIPRALLPEVRDCAAEFGETRVLGRPVPIRGMAGDQQAATLGQACFRPGMAKSTYGTGCFALLVTGRAVASRHRLLTTLAWQMGGERVYALEGAIFNAGATVQWLRDGLGIIRDGAEATALAEQADPAQRVLLVPAFTGLGAPWWDAGARAAIFGITRGTGRAEIARAALEAVALQTRDLLEAMAADTGEPVSVLRVDGGMAASDWTMQALADLTGAVVDRPAVTETTALGAAWLAGVQSGLLPGPGEAAPHWRLERRFTPRWPADQAAARHAEWREAVRRVLSVRG
ncbi:MAG: glycerol kinase GlpK [Rhodovarius sp.]|nr:glycerol kinase GlpK [Rhodovarius sp.]MDW8314945.1 glycerol kinase GlpK [Rhodovarius sp.]